MFKLQLLNGEKVKNVYRQAESVLFKPVLIIFVLIYFPWFFLIKFEMVQNSLRLLIFWSLLVLLYALNTYFLWLLNINLITNKRLIQIQYFSLFNKKVIEAPVTSILNASFLVSGFWNVIFKTGNVVIQTQGLKEPIIFKNVSHPEDVKDSIWQSSLHIH